MLEEKKIKIAIFASGNGTNMQQIAEHFANHNRIDVAMVFVNNEKAFVIQRAEKLNIPCVTFHRRDLYDNGKVIGILQENQIDWIVLAGFLWLMPKDIITLYHNKIINIHPALLPNFGGKGMYGHHVHEAVIAARETRTGISIHYVNEQYDAGDLIFQASCAVEPNDTPDDVADKIHLLEKKHFPAILEKTILDAACHG